MGVGSEMQKQAVQLATLKTAFDALCEQILEEQQDKRETDKRQDRELQQIRSHLRLPPP